MLKILFVHDHDLIGNDRRSRSDQPRALTVHNFIYFTHIFACIVPLFLMNLHDVLQNWRQFSRLMLAHAVTVPFVFSMHRDLQKLFAKWANIRKKGAKFGKKSDYLL